MAKILLTEDDESVRNFVDRALQLDGHTVFTASDGEEGYDSLIEHEGDFDLLLTDIKMPFMDGIELAHSAAAHYPHLKILMMTGFADQRERADTLNAIVLDVVSKPFSLSEIRKAVSLAVESKEALEDEASKNPACDTEDYEQDDLDNNRFSTVRKASA